MKILIIVGLSRRTFRAGVDEFTRRITHAGWRSTTMSLKEFLAQRVDPSEYDEVAVAGGDGTLNACLEKTGAAPIVLVPVGTGNDFARCLSIRSNTDSSRLLRCGYRQKIDLGRARADGAEKLFANGIGLGLDGQVAQKHGMGISYRVSALAALYRLPRFECTLAVDGGTPEKVEFLSMVVANGCYFGGGFKMAPKASIVDGKLDIVGIAPVGRVKYLRSLGKVHAGDHLGDPVVRFQQCRHVVVESESPLPWHIDGEPRSSRRIEIDVLPKARYFYCAR